MKRKSWQGQLFGLGEMRPRECQHWWAKECVGTLWWTQMWIQIPARTENTYSGNFPMS